MTDITMDLVRQKLAGHRALLVGGAGFIGHHLALALREYGVAVMVMDNQVVNNMMENVYHPDRDPVKRQAYQNFLMERYTRMREAGVVLKNADARLMEDMFHAYREFSPTLIVHLSAIASAVDARKVPGLAFDLTLITLRNILELAREEKGDKPHVMTMSSSTVYGDFETPIVDETVRPKPKGIYANSKYMGERLIRTYCESYGMSGTIIRPSALYGERCISGRVSQAFIENALTGKPLLLEGGGSGRLDFTHISDLVDGMVRALAMRPEKGDTTYNLTFGNARTIAELAAIVKSVIPEAILEERPAALEKPIRGTLSTDRAQRTLGFVPKQTLEIGYRRYCEWYVENWERAKRQVAQ